MRLPHLRLSLLVFTLGICGIVAAQNGPVAHPSESVPAHQDVGPAEPMSMRHVVDIAAGEQHSVAVLDDGSVWTWGLSGNGQLGREVTIDDYWLPRRVDGVWGDLVAAGGSITYVYADRPERDTLWSTGYNHKGYLGYGPTGDEPRFTPRSFPELKDLASWGSTTLALLADGTLMTWGAGESGQLGTGATPLVQVEPVMVPGIDQAVAIGVGGGYSLVLMADGTVRTWGMNNANTLGVSGISSTASTTRSITGRIAGAVSGVVSRASASKMFSDVPVEPAIDEVIAIAAGGEHVLVVRSDSTVWGWGSNRGGALGEEDHAGTFAEPFQIEGLSSVVAVAAGREFSLALTSDGSAWMWGTITGSPGYETPAHRIRRVPDLASIAQIEAGHRHAFALSEDGTLWGWGLSSQGQVGAEASEGATDWPPLPIRFTP
ncbi:MAG: hypothetical protein AAF624_04435 [Bacteroidota bacterium]